jgi:capsular polysaccharide transport system permease protein
MVVISPFKESVECGDDASEAGTGSRALFLARELRAAHLRDRRRRRLIYAGIIGASVSLASLYGSVIAAPRYAAETLFSVRGNDSAGAAQQPVASMISQGASSGIGTGFVDGFAVAAFIQSRDGMQQLQKRLNLRAMLSNDGLDPMARLSPDDGSDALYRAYQRAVSAKFNMIEQENVVDVEAFSPEDSRMIADAVVAVAQDFVERTDEQGVRNSLEVSAGQLHAAEDRAAHAANAVAAWRSSNHNIDPEAESTMIMQMIGQIEQELTRARINYSKIAAVGNPDHLMLVPAREQVTALEAQLAQTRARLAGGANSQAAQFTAYNRLKNAQAFADNDLVAARDAYQQAVLQATRLRRYLTVIARPVAQAVPSSPRVALLALEGLLVGVVLAFLSSFGMSLRRRV